MAVGVRDATTLCHDVVVLSEDPPISISHALSWLHHDLFISLCLIDDLLLMLRSCEVTLAKEELGLVLLGIKRVDIDGGVFFGIPIEKKDLFELVTRTNDLLALIFESSKVLRLNLLNLLVFNQIAFAILSRRLNMFIFPLTSCFLYFSVPPVTVSPIPISG